MFKKIKQSFVKIYDSIEKKKYKKSMLHFYPPKLKTGRVAENLEGLTEFDLTNEFSEVLGIRNKRFVMLDKSFISAFINDVKKGNTSYRTYLNNEDIKSDEIPSKISVMIKLMNQRRIFSEIIASKIMNFFEVETAYNFGVVDKVDGQKYLASIDFIKHKEEFVTFLEYDEMRKFSKKKNLKNLDDAIRNIISSIKVDKLLFVSKKQLDSIVEDILYYILIKRSIVGDFDSHSGNVGILIKNHKIISSPAFDFDCSFGVFSLTMQDLKYINDNYENVYKKFKSKFYEIIKEFENNNSIIQRIVFEVVDNQDEREDFLNKIKFYIIRLKDYFYSIENLKEKS